MQLTRIIAAFALPVVSMALAVDMSAAAAGRSCVTHLPQDGAKFIVNNFISILSHENLTQAKITAENLLADNFIEISDSILSLQMLPLNTTTFPDKQDYIRGVLNAPAIQGIETLAVYSITGADNIDKILWQWMFTGVGTKLFPVKGFNLFTLNDAMQIEKIEMEFNSIAWGMDEGDQFIRGSEQTGSK